MQYFIKRKLQALENGIDTSSEPSTSGCFSNVSQKNDLDQRVEEAGREIQVLYEQHNSLLNQHNFLLSLKQKAETNCVTRDTSKKNCSWNKPS